MIPLVAQTAIQQTAGSQVRISECSIALPEGAASSAGAGTASKPVDQTNQGTGDTHSAQTSNTSVGPGYEITIVFENQANLAAKEVDFAFGPFGRRITDAAEAGTFSPRIAIKRRSRIHPQFTEASSLEQGVCTVTRVVYADGSVWTPPSGP